METRDNVAIVEMAKKESKRLLKLSEQKLGKIEIKTLSEAQGIVARLKGYASWHDFVASKNAGTKNAEPESTDSCRKTGNIFSRGTADELISAITSCMPKDASDSMWSGRATSLLSAYAHAAAELRDVGTTQLDKETFCDGLELDGILRIIGEHSLDDNAKRALLSYLKSLPGFDFPSRKPNATAREQHGYLTMIIRHAINVMDSQLKLHEIFNNAKGVQANCKLGNAMRIPLGQRHDMLTTNVALVFSQPGPGKNLVLGSTALEIVKQERFNLGLVTVGRKTLFDSLSHEVGDRCEKILFEIGKDGFNKRANPFDTLLGKRSPNDWEIEDIVDFLMATQPSGWQRDEISMSATRNALKDAAQETYRDTADDAHPFVYDKGLHPDVDNALQNIGASPETWWEAVDVLFENDRIKEAVIAQTMAVPTINEVLLALTKRGDSPISKAISARSASLYLSARTSPEIAISLSPFTTTKPKIVMFDFTDLGTASSLILFMSARIILNKTVSKAFATFNHWETDDFGVKSISEKYRRAYAARWKSKNPNHPGSIIIDELQRFSISPHTTNAIIDDMRNCRKFGAPWMGATQDIERRDRFTNDLLEYTTVKLDISETDKNGIRATLDTSTVKGIAKGEVTISSPSELLWETCSLTEDVDLKNFVAGTLGYKNGLRWLSRCFPAGSWFETADKMSGTLPWNALTQKEKENLMRQIVDRQGRPTEA